MELTKSEKKIVRGIIEIGLQREFAKGLSDADSIIEDWKNHLKDNRESYHLLYKQIAQFDKHIARRYDAMTGSKYFYVLAAQFADNTISENDLENVPEHIIQALKLIASR
jgi:hypothetical protein